MLYTLFHSPATTDHRTVIAMLTAEDAVLFLQDGVTAAIKDNAFLQQLTATSATLFALQTDIVARGLTTMIDPIVTVIDYLKFVELTEQHIGQIVW